jgi:hypothetical protein
LLTCLTLATAPAPALPFWLKNLSGASLQLVG